jgi:hypothetical protein
MTGEAVWQSAGSDSTLSISSLFSQMLPLQGRGNKSADSKPKKKKRQRAGSSVKKSSSEKALNG